MKYFRLDFHGDRPVVRPVTVTMAGTIKAQGAITAGNRTIKSRPVLTRSGITMNQHHRTSLTFDDEMEICSVYIYKAGLCPGVVMGDPGGKVTTLKFVGNAHFANFGSCLMIMTSRSGTLGVEPGELLAARRFRRRLEGFSYIFRDVRGVADPLRERVSHLLTVAAHRANCLPS